MHRLTAGIFFFLSSIAWGQINLDQSGVESLGFAGCLRPDCWTPMVVKIVPATSAPRNYELWVIQKDLDGDKPVYFRGVTVTGNAEGQPANAQRFGMYFIPSPVGGGLPTGLADLQRELRVELYDAQGKKLIAKLPITQTAVRCIDPPRSMFGGVRGQKLILCVQKSSQGIWSQYYGAQGLLEDLEVVPVSPADLPENVIGYEAVDGIVWLDADPLDVNVPGEERRAKALERYVKEGGRLVVCQSLEWRRTAATMGFMLPVTLLDMQDKDDPEPLRRLANPQKLLNNPENPWRSLRGPFPVARALAKRGAVVDEWIEWDVQGKDRTPFLARWTYGLGCVTWVAQDLGSRTVTRAGRGWPYVWDKVFDWKQPTRIIIPGVTPPEEKGEYESGHAVDLNRAMPQELEMSSKSAGLVVLAVFFFIVYWAVAGPGSYLFLVNRKRSSLSWFTFAIVALAAVGLTVLIVRLVLRGEPQIKHFSVVQMSQDGTTIVRSRFGLYIPQDGVQRIAIKGTELGSPSYVTPLAVHPEYVVGEQGFTANLEYKVEVRDPTTTTEPAVQVPFRSTLKKLEARWVGKLDGGIGINKEVKLLPSANNQYIEGELVNNLGTDLQHVFIAFNHPDNLRDWLLYLPGWKKGQSIDLNREFKATFIDPQQRMLSGPCRDMLGLWEEFWQSVGGLRRGRMGLGGFNLDEQVRHSFVMMSLFGRLVPPKNKSLGNGRYEQDRYELMRRGARFMDLSQVLSSGSLLVLAQTANRNGPLPFPIEVQGIAVQGQGTTLFQLVIPMDHGKLELSTTQQASGG